MEALGVMLFIMKIKMILIASFFAGSLLIFTLSFKVAKDYHAKECLNEIGAEVWIPSTDFVMGEDNGYPEEAPAHTVKQDGFWIDAHEITNGQFAKFVKETGYKTVAERTPEAIEGAPPEMMKPGSAVFTPPKPGEQIKKWWSYIPGANWKNPDGPGSGIAGKENYPVVHIAFEDALAYADWAGRSLPTEAQFELAARSSKEKETFAWGGKDLAPGGKHLANTFQGLFPVSDTGDDGFKGIAPVGCFSANDYDAYDLIGNVWEWTANWYAPRHNPEDRINPKGPGKSSSYDVANGDFPVKVLKGGSYLCSKDYCVRYRPAARHAQDTGLGTGHIGFRTVRNSPK